MYSYIYLYLGKGSTLEKIQYVLRVGERAYKSNEWQKVNVNRDIYTCEIMITTRIMK